jgi:hypothetical protein
MKWIVKFELRLNRERVRLPAYPLIGLISCDVIIGEVAGLVQSVRG